MLQRQLLVVLLLTFSAVATMPAWAYGFNGHKAVCQIAYELLDTDTQQAIDEVMQQQAAYQSFAEACTWPDDIKSNHDYDWAGSWHYINVARTQTQVSMQDCDADGCVLSAIPEMQARLRADHSDWQALLFLAHFIGDLHQPLHVSYADDRGGNRAAIEFRGKASNLHSLWDWQLLQARGIDQWQQFASNQRQQITAEQRQQWQQGTPSEWATDWRREPNRVR